MILGVALKPFRYKFWKPNLTPIEVQRPGHRSKCVAPMIQFRGICRSAGI